MVELSICEIATVLYVFNVLVTVPVIGVVLLGAVESKIGLDIFFICWLMAEIYVKFTYRQRFPMKYYAVFYQKQSLVQQNQNKNGS